MDTITPDKGKHWLPREIAKMCYETGWKDADKLLIAVSVCIAEGNGYEGARHVNDDGYTMPDGTIVPPSIDRGGWQINDRAHPDVTDAMAFDFPSATKWAYKIYVARSYTFNAWSAYLNNAYRDPRAMGYAFDGVANFLRLRHGYVIPS